MGAMVRTQLYLTASQHALLRARAARRGRTVSDEVREAVDASFAADLAEAERLRALRLAWVENARLSGPAWDREDDVDGAAYVERIRSNGAARFVELDRRWHGDEPDEG